jgi:hypothetical protein
LFSPHAAERRILEMKSMKLLVLAENGYVRVRGSACAHPSRSCVYEREGERERQRGREGERRKASTRAHVPRGINLQGQGEL